ncbi:MAG: carbonic anhydrase [Deltaproteobacteria bacterium]|nr:MAG: carbonic anhydrase [Deltaproteobacteria bacterium]
MDKLIDGVRQFRSAGYSERRELFKALSSGQAPRILFVTCSDSRVAPHLITSSEPGDLFVIRNAGNLVPAYSAQGSGEDATVEYAVAALGVEHIIVCGHSGCGAMGGLLAPESLGALPAVASWLRHARSTAACVHATVSEDADHGHRLKVAVETNVLRQLDNLKTHPSVAAALARHAVKLHGWVYDIGTGSIRSYDPDRQTFVELGEHLHSVERYLRLAAG